MHQSHASYVMSSLTDIAHQRPFPSCNIPVTEVPSFVQLYNAFSPASCLKGNLQTWPFSVRTVTVANIQMELYNYVILGHITLYIFVTYFIFEIIGCDRKLVFMLNYLDIWHTFSGIDVWPRLSELHFGCILPHQAKKSKDCQCPHMSLRDHLCKKFLFLREEKENLAWSLTMHPKLELRRILLTS